MLIGLGEVIFSVIRGYLWWNLGRCLVSWCMVMVGGYSICSRLCIFWVVEVVRVVVFLMLVRMCWVCFR